MDRRVRTSIAAAVIIAIAGLASCASPIPSPTLAPDGIALLTQPEPPISNVCPAALGQGRLAPNETSGLGLASETGETRPIRWPFGFTARRVDGLLELIYANGSRAAREGDMVEFGGGIGADDIFSVCPAQIRVIEVGS